MDQLKQTKKATGFMLYPASILLGVATGLACSFFLWLLDVATSTRKEVGFLHLLLPLAGVAVAWLYKQFHKDIEGGNNLILDEIHEQKRAVPFLMAPLILFTTVWTHLFGGSAGREGSAVQMGGAISDFFARLFHFDSSNRRSLLIAGLGCGFGAAVGAPIAGIIFGHEVLKEKGLELKNPLPTIIACAVGALTAHLVHAPHTHYPELSALPLSLHFFGAALLGGFFFGIAAFIFCAGLHIAEHQYKGLRYNHLFKIFIAGIVLAIVFQFSPEIYQGLGLETIITSLQTSQAPQVFLVKIILTIATLAVGFKGGEFTPLVFIGATLGSALAVHFGVPVEFLAALGFAAVFGAAARTPLACAVMLCEIFPISYFPYALICCFAATWVAITLSRKFEHNPRLYRGQRW